MSSDAGSFWVGFFVALLVLVGISSIYKCSRGDEVRTVECIDNVLYEKVEYEDLGKEYHPMRVDGKLVHCPVGEIVEKSEDHR